MLAEGSLVADAQLATPPPPRSPLQRTHTHVHLHTENPFLSIRLLATAQIRAYFWKFMAVVSSLSGRHFLL